MKNWLLKNKDAILASAAVALIIFALATDEPIPEETEPAETESQTIQWKEPEPTIWQEDVPEVEWPSETESKTVESTEISIETETEIVEETETEPEEITYYCEWMDRHFTEEEFALICTTTFCESSICSSTGQRMVATAILNQIASGRFGDSVREVIFRKNNFEVTEWPDFEERGWTSRVEQAVLAALDENPYPRNMYYFRTDHYHTFGKPYMSIDNVYFSTDK